MKKSLLLLVSIHLFSSLAAQNFPYTVSGGSGMPPLQVVYNSPNRLGVYVLNGLSKVQITFTSSNSGTHQWYRYQDYASNAVPVSSVQNGNTSTITDVQDGYGYFVGLPTEALPYYVWIIDYSKYVPHFISLQPSEDEFRCSVLKISANVEADPLMYYLPSGARINLTRIYHLRYNTQVWSDVGKQFIVQEEDRELNGNELTSDIPLSPPPLSNTSFTLTGDTIAEYFGMQQTITSAEYQAVAVAAEATAETTKESASNEIHHAGDVLGGSAPIEYTFTAYANEPVAALYIWKIARLDSASGAMVPIVRYPGKVLQYNFDQNGTYAVGLEVSDAQSVCVDTAKNFNVVIDNTVIQIPNAFSPGSSFGVNDELRISFTSVITFKASVFNRWGNLLFQWTDPAKGWDGRVNGKFAPTGVYYVIVEYKDSNGKNRTISRAVNLLREKNL